ncbi:GNAT family N-acetyltransferase [Streptomyces aculeolatus]
MAETFLRGLTRWQADTQREAVADVHVLAYDALHGAESGRRREFSAEFAGHVQRPGFEMAVAGGSRPLGCAYGFRAARSGEWWRGYTGAVPEEIERFTASGEVFLLAELMVLPAHQRRHIATRLQEHLLTRCRAALAVALIDPANGRARAAYRSWAWTRLGHLQSRPEAPPQDVWGCRPAVGFLG